MKQETEPLGTGTASLATCTRHGLAPSGCRRILPASCWTLLASGFFAIPLLIAIAAQPEPPPWTAPDSANAIANPISADAGSISRGKESSQLEQEVGSLKKIVDGLRGGSSKHLFSGYAFAGYEDRTGESGSFNAGFNPIFLWKPADRLFFEGELELELSDGETELSLEYAHLNYSLNDYVTLGAGKFLSPFGIFRERLHPAWINKLPDAPLAYGHDGIIPPTILGAQIRGGIPVGHLAQLIEVDRRHRILMVPPNPPPGWRRAARNCGPRIVLAAIASDRRAVTATPSGTSPSITCAFAPISPLRIHASFSRFFRRATDRNSCPDNAKNQSSEMIKLRRIKVVNTTQTIGGIRIHGWSSDSFVLPLRLAPPASATMAACAPRNRSATRLLVDVGFRSAVGSSFAQKWRELSLLEIPPPKFIGSLRQLGSRQFPISNRRAAL